MAKARRDVCQDMDLNNNNNEAREEQTQQDVIGKILYDVTTIALLVKQFALILGMAIRESEDQKAFSQAIGHWEPCVVSALYAFVRKMGGAQNVEHGTPELWRLLTDIGNTMEALNMYSFNHYRVMVDGVAYRIGEYEVDETLKSGIDVRKITLIPEEAYRNLRTEQKVKALDPNTLKGTIERFAKATKSSNQLHLVALGDDFALIDGLNCAAETYFSAGLFYGFNAERQMAHAIALDVDLGALTGVKPFESEALWVRKYLVPVTVEADSGN